jgi:hypothetical protein
MLLDRRQGQRDPLRQAIRHRVWPVPWCVFQIAAINLVTGDGFQVQISATT